MLFTAYLIIANERILVNHYLLDFGFRFAEILHAANNSIIFLPVTTWCSSWVPTGVNTISSMTQVETSAHKSGQRSRRVLLILTTLLIKLRRRPMLGNKRGSTLQSW
jgi:hypothetical protein